MPFSLFALFLAAFSIGTAEFVIAGLLPDVSSDLGVSIPTAGILITAYAIGVAVGGPVITMALGRVPRRNAVLMLVGAFTAGQVLCALAPNYPLLMAARLLVSLGHGAFFGVAAILATRLVPPGRSGRAVALLLAGITVANVIGVPAGTAIGNAFGWRATFWAVALLGLVALAANALQLPHDAPDARPRPGAMSEIRVLARPAIFSSFAVIIVAMVGQFSLFTYIAPFLTTVTGVASDAVPWLLLLFGLGSTIGVLAGGRLADWKLMPSLVGMLVVLAVVYAALALFGHNLWLTAVGIVLWAGLSFGFGAPAQTRILKAAADAPNLASPLIPTAFNIGIALGASIGALLLDRGWGYANLPWIGTIVSAAAAVLAIGSIRLERPATRVEAC